LFEQHDQNRFETFAVSLRAAESTAMGQRVSASFSRFIDASALSSRAIAEVMRGMEIDIAVDLAGFTGGMRAEVFAHRAAPIQVNYLGFPATMGTDYMDYLIADAFLIPANRAEFYCEQIVYMPDCFQGNDDKRPIDDCLPTRAAECLPDESFVFCSFNSSYKISPAIFDIWMRLLRRVPESVLWLVGETAEVRNNLRREAQARGVDQRRLVFAQLRPYSKHLSRLRLADLFLDTLPFNAGATASDALWAGLPLLTCAGDAYAGRMAGSLLTAAGLPELITYDLDRYESRALQLVSHRSELAALRDRLVRNRRHCALFDTKRFRLHLESAYVQMWERHQRGEAPSVLRVHGID
jgi:predicted O-linked N-acetylglucosamine transferase (SPINDLY family)